MVLDACKRTKELPRTCFCNNLQQDQFTTGIFPKVQHVCFFFFQPSQLLCISKDERHSGNNVTALLLLYKPTTFLGQRKLFPFCNTAVIAPSAVIIYILNIYIYTLFYSPSDTTGCDKLRCGNRECSATLDEKPTRVIPAHSLE